MVTQAQAKENMEKGLVYTGYPYVKPGTIEKYFYWNDTLPIPSSLKMWEMYEKNNYELEYL